MPTNQLNSHRYNALVSVSNPDKLILLGRLITPTWRIYATDGSQKKLYDVGVPARFISDITGHDDVIGPNGELKIKTLTTQIIAGIHGNHSAEAVRKVMEKEDITPIHAVFINPYDFDEQPSLSNIDLSLVNVCAAVKNGRSVIVVVDPDDYETVVNELCKLHGEENGLAIPPTLRSWLAVKAMKMVADYYASVADWLKHQNESGGNIFK